jgi:3-deoxy-D-manno-octulosonate 8-phosphate phosphatase (KDO 8-P phosphatase)
MLSTFKTINTIILDIDGVLTSGDLLLMSDGSLLRTMNVKDGYAMQLAIKKGLHLIVISGGKNEAVRLRLEGLGVSEVHLNIHNKAALLQDIATAQQIDLQRCAYIGDDMPDCTAMALVGMPCAPRDACKEVLEIAKYVSPLAGGAGCVRDVIEKVLKLAGQWE